MDELINAAAALARAALPHFGVDEDATLAFVKYRENVVFRVDDDGDTYALRIARPGYRTDAQVESEVAYVRALRAVGVEVPDFIDTRDGSVMSVHQDGDQRHQVLVQEWVDGGTPLEDIAHGFDGTSALTAAQFERIGALAARMHDAAGEIGKPAGYDRPAWDAEGLAGSAPLWGDPRAVAELTADQVALLDAASASLRRLLADAGEDAEVFGVLHADFTPENILVTESGDLVLIDFDDFGEGWHAFDLATTLFFFQPHPSYLEYREALERGYTADGTDRSRTLALVDPLLLARGLTYLGWAAERRGDEAAEFLVAEVVPLVLRLAREHLTATSTRSTS